MHGSTGGRWKRVDGGSYPGTKLETAETAKDLPVRYRATALPYIDLYRDPSMSRRHPQVVRVGRWASLRFAWFQE